MAVSNQRLSAILLIIDVVESWSKIQDMTLNKAVCPTIKTLTKSTEILAPYRVKQYRIYLWLAIAIAIAEKVAAGKPTTSIFSV